MPDALLIMISVTVLYGLGIILAVFVSAKKGGRVYRVAFFNLCILYFLCLIIANIFPTKMSFKNNHIIPFAPLIEAIRAKNSYLIINHVSHALLSILIYLPMGMIVYIFTLMSASTRNFLSVLGVTFIVSAVFEMIQILLPHSAEIDDIIFALIGAAFGAIAVMRQKEKENFKLTIRQLLP